MKFQYDEYEAIIISLSYLFELEDIIFIKKFNNIFIFGSKNKKIFRELNTQKSVVYYLDKFIIVLPERYTTQNQLWQDFYQMFGNQYETLVNKKNNQECIELMLNIISFNTDRNCKILDFGCGSGLSLEIKHTGEIYGYELVDVMKNQAQNKGMIVYDSKEINNIPNGFFDAVFSSYVFHMGITNEDIERIIPKIKKGGLWVANFYKEINVNHVNKIFKDIGFITQKKLYGDERHGSIYEYRKQ